MKNKIIGAIAGLMLLVCSGCAYVNIRTPFDGDLDQTELGTKIGRSSNYSVFWLVSWGDGSYAAAARDGDIKVMKHADQEIFQLFFGLYLKRTVIVYGD